MLCIDLGAVPSDLVGHALPPDALVFSHAHVHKSAVADQCLQVWASHGVTVECVESPPPRTPRLRGWTPETCLDADVHAADVFLRHVAPRLGKIACYLKFHGCADVSEYTTGEQRGRIFRFDDPAANDADALQHGRVPRVDDPTLAPASLFTHLDDARLQASRRAHVCLRGHWPEVEAPEDVVARANGMRQLAQIALRHVLALVARIRAATNVPLLIFGSATVGIGAHNGTPEDPWDTRSFCAVCGTPHRAHLKEHVRLDEILPQLLRALLTKAPLPLDRYRTPRRVVLHGNGWVKTYTHADLRWYCVIHTDSHCWVYDLLSDPEMLTPLDRAPREVVTHGDPIADDVMPPHAWLQLPDIRANEELTIIVARREVPIVLQGTWQHAMLAHLAKQRCVLKDILGDDVPLTGSVNVRGMQLLGKSHTKRWKSWTVHMAA